MENMAQYRCYFLDATGALTTDETIECAGEQEEDAQIHQMVELIHQQEALTELLGSGSNAVDRIASLTPRDRQIMEMILAGRHNKEIAADLGLSQRTVENHRAAVMRKTGSKSLPALVRLALAAAWYSVREHKPEIGIIALMTQIEKPRDNDNYRVRRFDALSALRRL